ncbi:MAG TPA: photosystem reaction center subunit H [Flavobacteriaceae bacterium]|nr:photosystem reaction center subunit H [Flavobacteriaceae bacterium]
MNNENKYLYYPNELTGFELESEMPDMRGWEVKDRDRKTIGKVDDFLVNKEMEQIVYLDIKVDDSILLDEKSVVADRKEFINKEGEDHLLLPVGLVSIDEAHDEIITDEIGYQVFANAKRRKKEAPIDRDYEEVLLDSYQTESEPLIENRADRAYPSRFYERKEFSRSQPFGFRLMRGKM